MNLMPRAFGNRLKQFPFRRTSQPPVKATVLMRSHEHPKRNPERPFTRILAEMLINFAVMAQTFAAGDDLIFQLESGFGLLRVIAVDQGDAGTVWHLLAYEEFFPDVESAERALAELSSLHIRNPHMALTDRAFERTPAARLGNRPVTDAERVPYLEWTEGGGEVSDRSALLMLGIR